MASKRASEKKKKKKNLQDLYVIKKQSLVGANKIFVLRMSHGKLQ